MKKIYLVCSLFFLAVSGSYSQKQANMWYFGDNAGLNFNSGAPVSFSGSAMVILEGCASIADSNGNTLFYTNGVQVWNKNNQQMPNGFGLLGNDNAAQSAIIVPFPGSSTKYYIFTAPTYGNLPMNYNVVDMTMQGGLGDVATKNVAMFNNSTEKVTAVYDANGHDIWVVGHEFGTNNFYSYLVTSGGVSTTPVITSVGSVHTSVLGYAGYMKASHNGHKIAYACTINMNIVELLDFDNSTGIPSNPVTFSNCDEAYGLEFSPDDSKLYATEENPRILLQWDVNAGDSAAILASRDTIFISSVPIHFAALQLAVDGKIYMAKLYTGVVLAAINKPNLYGAACQYVDTAVTLTSGSCQYGLPNFFQSYFSTNPVVSPTALFSASDTVICAGSCVTFSNLSTNGVSYQWLFPGGSRLTDTSFTPQNVCYNSAGKYDVSLIAYNSSNSDTLVFTKYITVTAVPVTGTLQALPDTICAGNISQLSATGSTDSIQWQSSVTGNNFSDLTGADSATYSSLPLFQTIYYRLIATNGVCADTSAPITVIVNPNPSPPVLSTNDSMICASDSALITTSGSYSSYLWNNGSTGSYTYTNAAGGYWVTVTDANGCSAVSSHQKIYVYPVPSVSIVVQGDTLSSFDAISYQWFLNGDSIPNADLPTYIATQSGNYSIGVTDTNGCKAISNAITITGVQELAEESLSLYPNPSVSSWQLTVGNELIGSQLEVYDGEGRIVFKSAICNLKSEITLDVAKGVYWLRITSPTISIAKKLIKL